MVQIMPEIAATTTLVNVKDRFTSYFSPKKNIIFERAKFNRRIQQVNETVDSFVTALFTLADTCDYGDIKEQLIRDCWL